MVLYILKKLFFNRTIKTETETNTNIETHNCSRKEQKECRLQKALTYVTNSLIAAHSSLARLQTHGKLASVLA